MAFQRPPDQRSSSSSEPYSWCPSSLLGRLVPRVRSALLDLGVRRWFRAGQILMHEGDNTTHAVLILTGYLKITATAEDGGSALLAIRPPGDLVGELAALNGTPRVATVSAPVEVVGNQINQAEILAFLRRTPAAMQAITGMLGDRLHMSNRRRLDISSAVTKIRVARILIELEDCFGRDTAKGRAIEVLLTQPELADLAGVSTITVQRALRELRAAGLIAIEYRRVVVLHPRRLRQLARQGEFQDPII